MHIFRWLMKHPILIVAVYLLAIAAILFSMTGGGSADKDAGIADSTEAQKAESSEVDITKAPKIEPSTLTSSLVDGEAKKAEENSTEAKVAEDDTPAEEAKKTEGEIKATEETVAEEVKKEATDIKEEVKTTEEAVVEEVKTEVVDSTKDAEKVASDEATSTTAEVTQAADTTESSAANYFKEHGVDPALNKPVTVMSESEEKPETQESESKEEVASTETTETASSTDAPSEAETATAVTETQFTEMSTDELLLMAREAYWNNGLEESAEIYQQLINASPDVVDYKGELGNVYWRQGFPKKAAELYAEISMPMIEAGKADKVANMVGFIGLFFPDKATEIHNKLQAGK